MGLGDFVSSVAAPVAGTVAEKVGSGALGLAEKVGAAPIIGGVLGGPLGAGAGALLGGVGLGSFRPGELLGLTTSGQTDAIGAILAEMAGVAPTPEMIALRQQQQDLLERRGALEKQFSNIASGQTPSLAEMQLRAGQEQGLRDQMAAIASTRGVSPELALNQQRLAAQESGRGLAQQGAILREAERRQALGDLGNVQTGTAQMQAQALQDLERDRAAALEKEKIRAGLGSTASTLETQARIERDKRRGDLVGNLLGSAGDAATGGALMSGGGAAPAFPAAVPPSDENLKTKIKDGEKEIRSVFDNLEPKSYKYKNEKHGKGNFLGIMAQDLEKSKMGKEMVMEGEDGKRLDPMKVFGAMLAANADLHKRVKQLEGGKNGK